MKSNIRDWNTAMKIRLLRKMSNWHLKHYDKESGRFSKPSVYNWSDRDDVDYSGKHIKSPDYMWHKLDYEPRYVIYNGDTKQFGSHICYNFNGKEYKVVSLPYYYTYRSNIKEKGRKYPYHYEFEYDREHVPLDYYWCCKKFLNIVAINLSSTKFINISLNLATPIIVERYILSVVLKLIRKWVSSSFLFDVIIICEMIRQ